MRKILVLACAALLVMAACSDNDDPTPMRWAGYASDSKVLVDMGAEGGTRTLTCTNYKNIWMLSAIETIGGDSVEYTTLDSLWDFQRITTSWADVRLAGSQVLVSVQPNRTGLRRTLQVGLEAGDVFDDIWIVQKAE